MFGKGWTVFLLAWWLRCHTKVNVKWPVFQLGVPTHQGVRITQVYPEGRETDFQVGDILTHLDGKVIEASEPQDEEVFETMIRNYPIGGKVEITLLRQGKTMTLSAPLVERPKPEKEFRLYENLDLNFKARDISYFDRISNRWKKDEQGAIISQVEAGGWATVGGLHERDLVQEVNGQPVNAVADLDSIMKTLQKQKAKYVALRVKRGIHDMFLELQPTWPLKETKS